MKKILSLATAVMILFGISFSLPASAASPSSSPSYTLKFLTSATYDDRSDHYSEGYIWVKEGSTYKYLDENGKVAIDLSADEYDPSEIDSVGDFHDGLALIQLKYPTDDVTVMHGNYFIDTKGDITLVDTDVFKNDDPDSISVTDGFTNPFSEGLTVSTASLIEGTKLINKSGDDQADIVADGYDPYSKEGSDIYGISKVVNEGLIPVKNVKTGKCGYDDTKGNVKIPCQFDDAGPFNQDLAPVEENDKWGFINMNGDFVIKPQYDIYAAQDPDYSHEVFNDGLALVEKNGKWGYIDKQGNTAVPFEFDDNYLKTSGMFFSNGYTSIEANGKYGYIDKTGKTVIEPKYEDANCFTNDGVALVKNDGVYKLIDNTGSEVSSKTWKFDACIVNEYDPSIVFYKQNGKWGIAKISKSDSSDPSNPTDNPSQDISVAYRAHVQNIGWQDPVANGEEAGTDGRALRVEALNIALVGAPDDASITYQAHVQKIGWQDPVSDGEEAGTDGRALRIEALKITLNGLDGYQVKYRAHVQGIGWQDWKVTKNGTDISQAAIAGTMGQAKRVEAIEIMVEKQ